MAKSKLSHQIVKQVGLKTCCFQKECTMKPGTTKCGVIDRMYKNRGGGFARKRKNFHEAEAKRKKELGEAESAHIMNKAKHRAGAECRAYKIGRCWNRECKAKHATDPKKFQCCSRKFGTPDFKPGKDICPMDEQTCWFANHMSRAEQDVDMFLETTDDQMQGQVQEVEEEVTLC